MLKLVILDFDGTIIDSNYIKQNAINDFASEDDLEDLDKKLRKPLDKIKEQVEDLEKNMAIVQKENELQDVKIEELKVSTSNPLGG